MRIDLKTELLRFLIPPSLFWSALILSDNIEQYNILFQNIWIFIVVFLSTGFIIGAIGAGVTHLVDKYKRPVWNEPKGELEYWKIVSDKGDYFSKKIEVKWHFYYLNLNSTLALLLSLMVMFNKHSVNCGLVVFVIVTALVFASLAIVNYRRAKEFGDIITKESK